MTNPNENKPESAKILLVEDDQFISRAYGDGLRREGFDVTAATDGVEALERVRSGLPDIILLDLIMPIKNGFEVLEELKADPATRKIPVIVLSNLGQDSDIQKGRELGACDYMIKSNYSMKEVIGKIRQYLEPGMRLSFYYANQLSKIKEASSRTRSYSRRAFRGFSRAGI